MKKTIRSFFSKWWQPVLFFGLTVVLFVLSQIFGQPKFQYYSLYLLGLGLVVLIVSTIYQIVNRKWLSAVFTTLISGVSIVGFLFYAVFMFVKIQSEPDRYADNLKIPVGIEILEPLAQKEPTNIAGTDFYLYRSFQPGLYRYSVWMNRIGKGKVYLKAFEITNNDPLSTTRLKERSSIQVYNPVDSLMRFDMIDENSQSDRHFTIYEGDWGKPYAARFELWFVPDDKGQEIKLMQKNYKIEGWQR